MRVGAIAALEQFDAAIDQRVERQRFSSRTDLLEHQAHDLTRCLRALRLIACFVALPLRN